MKNRARLVPRQSLLVALALVAPALVGCTPAESPSDGSTDAAADLAPEVCTDFPDHFDVSTTVAAGCYHARVTPDIASGVTITLLPGVKVYFADGTSLSFSSDQALVAIGTAAQPIVLTGEQQARGYWTGLRFDGTSVASHLDYVTVEYAGNVQGDTDSAAIKMTADSRGVRVGLRHTTLRQSLGWGLWATGSAVFPEFEGNTFTANKLGPANLDATSLGSLDGASTWKGNDRDQLVVRAYSLTTAATWRSLDVPYFFTDGLTIKDVELTILAGARFVMDAGVEWRVSGDTGGLIAMGTAESPIVMTGATATRGAWEGIVFDNSNNPHSLLKYVTVEWAGNTKVDADSAAIKLIADSSGVALGFEHVTLRQSQGWGLYLCASAVVQPFVANVMKENALGPAMVDSSAAHQLQPDSTFTGNDYDLVKIRAQWVPQSVTWRDLGVPYVFDGSVRPQKVWTLAPGVRIELPPQSAIEVSGDTAALNAVGTAAKPIVITGHEKTRGSWDAINFDTTKNASNVLDHCVIEYGGGGTRFGWNGMIRASADSHGVTVSVTNSTVQHSSTYGIWLGATHSGTITGNTYADNATGDVFKAQ